MRLAVSGLLRPHWSEQIHEEWMRNVHANHPDVTWRPSTALLYEILR
jgi:hypothetical protein